MHILIILMPFLIDKMLNYKKLLLKLVYLKNSLIILMVYLIQKSGKSKFYILYLANLKKFISIN